MGTMEEGARGGRKIYEQEAVGRNGWGERESRKGKGGKEAMNGDNQARGIEETKVGRASERETQGGEGRSSSVHGMPSGDIVANDSFATRSFL